MRVLNLFAGIGGNRLGFQSAAKILQMNLAQQRSLQDSSVVEEYSRNYPDDTIIIADAFDYAVKYFDKFDFIWASPPCQTHSRFNLANNANNIRQLPDFRLYALIQYLKIFCKSKWVVENVKSYYPPMYPPTFRVDRHIFWSNFPVPNAALTPAISLPDVGVSALQKWLGFEVSTKYSGDKRAALRNCVHPLIAHYIFVSAFKINSIDSYFTEDSS